MNSSFINGITTSCLFDMCALEGKIVDQNNKRCNIYSILAGTCYDYANNNNLIFNFAGWRDKTNCRKLIITYNIHFNIKYKKKFIFFKINNLLK